MDAAYFIQSAAKGDLGPLKEPATAVNIVYGKPVLDVFESAAKVSPLERAYELIRYDSTKNQGLIYIARLDPSNLVWGMDEKAVGVPTTPELRNVFDVSLPAWFADRQRYQNENLTAFNRGIELAGYTLKDAREILVDDIKHKTNRYNDWFVPLVLTHLGEIPKPILIKVEGLDAILDGIEITP